MGLTRYEIRNEYALANPELYNSSDNNKKQTNKNKKKNGSKDDDPQAILEGLAMAGLVGLLRQLGDLAQFAGEVFHELHEQVMATSAKAHGLTVRVQQIEAEVPSVERAILSQTHHSSFFSNPGVNWHPNLHLEQNLITRGDLPRFVMDSYEECRGPPRLYLLDKYDAAGAGACMKRFTDPSFFKVKTTYTGIANVSVHRGAKIHNVKSKGSHWRSKETQEVKRTSHAKLHQLFLEESIQTNMSDSGHIVKLKRRQLNDPSLDLKTRKNYMQKFLQDYIPKNGADVETSFDPLISKSTTDVSIGPGVDVVDITTVSPPRKLSPGKRSTHFALNRQEALEEPDNMSNDIDVGTLKPQPASDGEMIGHLYRPCDKGLPVDRGNKIRGSIRYYSSDDANSEVDNYMDALATMEPETDTDNDRWSNKSVDYLKLETNGKVFYTHGKHFNLHHLSSDSQSVGSFSASEDENSSFKRGRSSISYSDTPSTLAEDTPPESDGTVKVSQQSSETSVAEPLHTQPYKYTAGAQIPGTQSPDKVKNVGHTCKGETDTPRTVPTDCFDVTSHHTCNGEGKIPDPREVSTRTCIAEPGYTSQPLGSDVVPAIDDMLSDYTARSESSDVSYDSENFLNLGDKTIVSSISSLSRDDTISAEYAEDHAVNKLHNGVPMVSLDIYKCSPNGKELSSERRSSDNEVPEPQGKPHNENLASGKIRSSLLALSTPEEQICSSALLEIKARSSTNMSSENAINLEKSTSMTDTDLSDCSRKQPFSGVTDDIAGDDLYSNVAGAPRSEEMTLDETSVAVNGKESSGFSFDMGSTAQVIQHGDSTSCSVPCEMPNLDIHVDICNKSEAQETNGSLLISDSSVDTASSCHCNVDLKSNHVNHDKDNIGSDAALPLPAAHDAALKPGKLTEETCSEYKEVQNPLKESEEGNYPCSVQPPPPEGQQAQHNGEMGHLADASYVSSATETRKLQKLPRPPSPLIEEVAAHDKSMLRKVSELLRTQDGPQAEEKNSLLEQIRNKTFSLKPAVVSRPIVQGPQTNLRVAAILEKANKIRQATAGSDDEEDSDGWSDS